MCGRDGSSRPLHLWNDGETIEVLVPINETGVSDVRIYLTARPGAREIRDKIEETYDLTWNDKGQVKSEAGFTNEIVKAITREVDLSKREGLSGCSARYGKQSQPDAANNIPAIGVRKNDRCLSAQCLAFAGLSPLLHACLPPPLADLKRHPRWCRKRLT
jgi:hypothetical protein